MAYAPTPLPRSARPGGYPVSNSTENPFAKFFGSSKGANALIGLGTGLLSRPTFAQGLAAGGQGYMAGAQQDDAYAQMQREEEERQKKITDAAALKDKYSKFFIDNGRPDIAQGIVDDAIEPGKAYMDFIGKKGADVPANIQEWNAYNEMTPEQKAEYLRMKRATQYLDVGTGFVSPDPLNPGATAGPKIVKDNYTPKYDEALGAGEGKTAAETKAAFDSLNSKLPGLQSVVSELGELAEKATYTTAGKLWDDVVRETGNLPTDGALARTKYMSMVDNQVLPLLRDTFGAAFTVQEGESLRATLGAPDKSPDEKKAVLEAFIEQKVRDLEALQRRLPGSAPAASGSGDIDGILKGYGL